MKLRSHLRRLHARWRLHRMEWAAMHRPLQPPVGYEHYHTVEANFPGLRDRSRRPKNWAEFKTKLGAAWRLYKHHYIPDPELTAMEEREDLRNWRRREAKVRSVVRKGERSARKSVQAAEEAASDVMDELKKRRPEAESLIKNRISVLKDALNEFSEGYQEVTVGARNFWGQPPYPEDVTAEDNKPVLYSADSEASPDNYDSESPEK